MVNRLHSTGSLLLGLLLIGACERDGGPAVTSERAVAQTADAATEFQALSRAEDVAADDWFALAQRARQAGDFDTASAALNQSAADLAPPRVNLERARIEVAAERPAEAIAILRWMADSGFLGVALITDDPVLGGLKGDAGFDAIVGTMSRAAYPCRYDEEFRAFDFWIGEWDVHLPGGQFAGSNVIRSEEAGCMVTERWTSAGSGSGSSINYLDRTTGQWVQVWNSENGAQIYLTGGMTEEGMLLEGTLHYVANGTTLPLRGLWTPLADGRVRQYFEQSTDNGESWAPWFEGFYTRKSEPPTE